MAREFAARQFIHCPPERVFAFVADYRNVTPILDGVRKWEPTGTRSRGEGATFEVEMSTLGIPLRDVLQLDRWRPPAEIGWKSIGGIMPQSGRWQFRPRPPGTEVELRISYEPPGGILGERLAASVDGLVRRRLDRALERMRRTLEAEAEAS